MIFLQLYKKIKNDVFAKARARILALYLIVGVVITATTIQIINTQTWQIDFLVGLCIFILLGIYTFTLSSAALRPIQKTTERQRRFSGNVAHELRTPLSAMKTNFEVALMGVEGTGSAEAELSDAIRSGIEEIDRMSAITQFLLTYSAFEGQRMELEFTSIDLCVVVKETLRRMQPFIEGREVSAEAICPSPVMIQGNITALGEMLMNLIKNSIAYTPAHGSVTVTAKHDRGVPTLLVSDTGIGIPPNDIANIFEPFYRGENAYSQRTKKRGSGLGLAIVKEIAMLHHASIFVQSELGEGTTFSIRFPSRRLDTFQK